jgi:hypothetical protein
MRKGKPHDHDDGTDYTIVCVRWGIHHSPAGLTVNYLKVFCGTMQQSAEGTKSEK